MKDSIRQQIRDLDHNLNTVGNVIDKMISELENIRVLALGTHKTVKLMPGYEEALKQLQEEYGQEQGDPIGHNSPHEVREVPTDEGTS